MFIINAFLDFLVTIIFGIGITFIMMTLAIMAVFKFIGDKLSSCMNIKNQ